RTDPAYGNVYDHFSVEFVYPNDVKINNMCRQIDGTASRVSEMYIGAKGKADPDRGIIGGPRQKEASLGKGYVQEHADLIEAIRSNKQVNESQRLADSTLSAIMGRMSAYTGQVVTWEEALNSDLNLWPKDPLAFGPFPVSPVPLPGKLPKV